MGEGGKVAGERVSFDWGGEDWKSERGIRRERGFRNWDRTRVEGRKLVSSRLYRAVCLKSLMPFDRFGMRGEGWRVETREKDDFRIFSDRWLQPSLNSKKEKGGQATHPSLGFKKEREIKDLFRTQDQRDISSGSQDFEKCCRWSKKTTEVRLFHRERKQKVWSLKIEGRKQKKRKKN